MNESNSNDNNNIIPEYEVLKKSLLTEFLLSKQNIVSYIQSPSQNLEIQTRDSVLQLAFSLEFKSYFLPLKYRDTFNTLLSNPLKLKYVDLHLLFKLCHYILESSGLTKLETAQANSSKAWEES